MRVVLVAVWLALSAPVWGWKAPGQAYLRSQVSGWTEWGRNRLAENGFGLLFIPELSLKPFPGGRVALDADAAFEAGMGGTFAAADGELDTYRLWLRLSGSQWEARVGLQQINFGAATLLRPLMWFDRIDPRDPLGLTEGVWGMLGRYYFLNNANIWAWGLYGNDEPRGWDLLPPEAGMAELGGRVQCPMGNGEVGLTVHRRRVDLAGMLLAGDDAVVEQRLGLDGRWDLEIGLWAEGVVVHQELRILPFPYGHFLTVGADYTFAVGAGLHVLGEHLVLAQSDELFGADQEARISAVAVDYSPGMLDRLFAIAYYDWEEERFFRFARWGRIYDDWSVYVNGFWNPGGASILPQGGRQALGEGKGLQLMVVFNRGVRR